MGTKLLVIDDDPNISDLLRIFFETEGYEVRIAGDGIEGLSYFKMYEPDVVLLDLMLPKNKDGNQVCREIRAISSKPIIMITAKDYDVTDTVVALELGADDFLTKPFDSRSFPRGSRLFSAVITLTTIRTTTRPSSSKISKSAVRSMS